MVERTCARVGVPLVWSKEEDYQVEEASCFGQKFIWRGEAFQISLAGVYQIDNAALALTALRELERLGYSIPLEAVRSGLRRTRWNGRFTVIGQEPLFVVDGAHNPDAARKLEESVKEYFSGRTLYYIVGMFRDKDYDQVLRITAPYAKAN